MILHLTPDAWQNSRHNSAQCLIATAARRQWGGEWFVSDWVNVWSDVGGVRTYWRHTPSSALAMAAFEFRLPFRPRTAHLRRTSLSPSGRRRRRRMMLGGGTALAVLAFSGAWLPVVLAGAGLTAVLGARTAVAILGRRAGRTAPQLPSFSELSAMSPAQRRVHLGVREPAAAAPGADAPVPARQAARPRQIVPAQARPAPVPVPAPVPAAVPVWPSAAPAWPPVPPRSAAPSPRLPARSS